MHDGDPSVHRIIDFARQLEGVARNASTHAAGVVISREPLAELMPLQKATNSDATMTQYEMHGIEALGLLKFDFLGLSNLTILRAAVDRIREQRGVEIDLEQIPLDDPTTFALLASGETTGVFQLESAGMRRYIRELRPTSVYDLAAMVALYRPGPMENIPAYIRRKHGQEKVTYLHPLLEPFLERTHGIFVYQEDIMAAATALGGFSGPEADTLGYAIRKKKSSVLRSMKDQFVRQAGERGVRPDTIDAVFKAFEPFERYGFNKAHATTYGLVAYQTAYLKANYTVEYMASVLTAFRDNAEKVAAAVAECRRLGIAVLQPDVHASHLEFTVEGPRSGSGSWPSRTSGRAPSSRSSPPARPSGHFRSFADFCNRIDLRLVNKRVLESLIKVGALNALGHPAQLLAALDDVLAAAQADQRERASGQISFFDLAAEPSSLEAPLPAATEVPVRERLRWEKELLGLYLSDHPLGEVAERIGRFVNAYSGELKDETLDGQRVVIGGVVTGVRTIITKSRSTMAVATLEDLQGSVEVVIFPKLHEQTGPTWQEGAILLVGGRIDHRGEEVSLLADLVRDFDAAEAGGEEAFAAEFAAADRGRARGRPGANGNGNGQANGNGAGGAARRPPPGAPLATEPSVVAAPGRATGGSDGLAARFAARVGSGHFARSPVRGRPRARRGLRSSPPTSRRWPRIARSRPFPTRREPLPAESPRPRPRPGRPARTAASTSASRPASRPTTSRRRWPRSATFCALAPAPRASRSTSHRVLGGRPSRWSCGPASPTTRSWRRRSAAGCGPGSSSSRSRRTRLDGGPCLTPRAEGASVAARASRRGAGASPQPACTARAARTTESCSRCCDRTASKSAGSMSSSVGDLVQDGALRRRDLVVRGGDLEAGPQHPEPLLGRRDALELAGDEVVLGRAEHEGLLARDLDDDDGLRLGDAQPLDEHLLHQGDLVGRDRHVGVGGAAHHVRGTGQQAGSLRSGSASSWPTILRTVAVSAAGVGAAAVGRRRRGGRGGRRGIASAEEAVHEGHGRQLRRGSISWVARSVAAGPGSVVRACPIGQVQAELVGGGEWPRGIGAAGVRPSTALHALGQQRRPDHRGEPLGQRPPFERVGDLRGRDRDEPFGADEAREDLVEDGLDLVAEGVARAADAVRAQRDVGRQAHDQVVGRSPRADERLGREAVGAPARTQVVGEVVDDATIGDEHLGLGGQLQLLADLADEHPELGLAGRGLVDPERVVAHHLAPELDGAAGALDRVGERVGGRRLADPVGPDEGDLGAARPGGHPSRVAGPATRRGSTACAMASPGDRVPPALGVADGHERRDRPARKSQTALLTGRGRQVGRPKRGADRPLTRRPSGD